MSYSSPAEAVAECGKFFSPRNSRCIVSQPVAYVVEALTASHGSKHRLVAVFRSADNRLAFGKKSCGLIELRAPGLV